MMKNKRDCVCLKGMDFYGYHGVLAEEHSLGQRFVIDLELFLDLEKAGKSNRVEDTLNYVLIYEAVKRIVENDHCALIEALAQKIADEILKEFGCRKVKVEVHKPQAPIPGVLNDVSVVIWRGRGGHKAFLSLGSNVGKRGYNLREALKRLNDHREIELVSASHIYQSEPWGVEGQPDYWNMAAEVDTALSPLQLLKACQDIEAQLGRVRAERWGARCIDIDILLYDNQTVALPELTLPHPYMTERAFVLVPLQEIAPELKLPSGQAVKDLKGTGKVELI